MTNRSPSKKGWRGVLSEWLWTGCAVAFVLVMGIIVPLFMPNFHALPERTGARDGSLTRPVDTAHVSSEDENMDARDGSGRIFQRSSFYSDKKV